MFEATFDIRYRAALWTAVRVDIVVGLLCALLLDGGVIARESSVALVGHLALICLIVLRRPQQPSRVDLAVMSWAAIGLLGLVHMLRPVVNRAFP